MQMSFFHGISSQFFSTIFLHLYFLILCFKVLNSACLSLNLLFSTAICRPWSCLPEAWESKSQKRSSLAHYRKNLYGKSCVPVKIYGRIFYLFVCLVYGIYLGHAITDNDGRTFVIEYLCILKLKNRDLAKYVTYDLPIFILLVYQPPPFLGQL